jgi:Cft2 family RNA processing exonuclease
LKSERMFVPMFSLAQKSLYVADLDLWIDSMRPRARCYVSHGHADHAREHAVVITSANNARICRLRFGARRVRAATPLLPEVQRPECTFEEHAFNEPWSVGEHRLTLFSAGHVLAQLLIEGSAGSFVYTGDFKLEASYTAEAPEVKRCDVLLMECTYGRPQYVFPPRAEVAQQMVAWARRALEDGTTPVFYAYSLGKAQEALAILGHAGLPLTVHGAIYTMARLYEEAGVALPPYEKYEADAFDGTRVLVWPPSGRALPRALAGKATRSAALTGWAIDRNATYRYGTDTAFPLSDHADYPALLRYIELAQPRRVLLNHGWRDFVHRLRKLGVNAEYLEANGQLALF